MASRDPLFPNAAIVARREYRDRTRSPLYVASTVILMALALAVTLAPIGIRYLDRDTVVTIAVVADDDQLAATSVAVADSLLNVPPAGADPDDWENPFLLERATDPAAAEAQLASGAIGGILEVTRLDDGQLDVRYRTNGPGIAQVAQHAAQGDRSTGCVRRMRGTRAR
jgi:hypothetical protein